jgi:hypothetical protein
VRAGFTFGQKKAATVNIHGRSKIISMLLQTGVL